jgi:hypothetical protein
MPSRAAAVRELLRRALVSVEEGRLTTLNEQGELPVLEWIAVSGLIQVHRGPRPQGARRSPCAGASLSLLPFDADDDAPPGSLHTVGVAVLAAGVGRVRHRDVALRA